MDIIVLLSHDGIDYFSMVFKNRQTNPVHPEHSQSPLSTIQLAAQSV